MTKALLSKLKYKEGYSVCAINLPEYLSPVFSEHTGDSKGNAYDFIIVFVKDCAELNHFAPQALEKAHSLSIIWFCYPKQSSGVKTDLNRDAGWQVIKDAAYRPVAQCAIDSTWSATRMKPGEWPDLSIKKDRPEIRIPEDLAAALNNNPKALLAFDTLSYTHRKEYVKSVCDAKKPETRQRRIENTVEALLKPKK